ncbi:Fatty-acid amide hydrolase 2 [Orchesella cincta]|uniref:Fatty-acid amide hydrolase 2 n=1 Tax=Orchesella cincta TaxID=48709 RepID=A0A1D2M5K6_ORCCI|nr:Fatty-acid amide hydrolase 2 [Orchesella cincta]
MLIRNGEATSEEVVCEFIGRIQEVNSYVNGLVDERFEIAVEEARKVDKLIQSGELDEIELKDKFPLLGVPFTIKDSFCVAGLRHTAGSYYRKDIIAAEDAEVVKSLKSVGAIPIGVTNESLRYRHITVQGAAGSAFGIGSDIAGSIRVPSLFCGIFGHKPTSGIISCWATRSEGIEELLTTGPMARHANDLRLIFDVLIGESVHKMNKIPEKAQLRILFMEDDGGSPLASPVDPEMKDALRKAVQHLEQTYGVKAQVSPCNRLRRGVNLLLVVIFHSNCPRTLLMKANFSKLYHSLEIWVQAVSGAGGVPFCEELSLQKGKINPFWELVKFCFRISPHTLPAIMLGIIEKIAYVGNQLPRHKRIIEMGYSLAKEIQDVLKTTQYFVSHPAPRHYVPLFRPADFSYCAVFNVLVPVTQVPLGLGSKGLPLGVQVVGGMHSDHITISVAEELERAFGGWVQPSI